MSSSLNIRTREFGRTHLIQTESQKTSECQNTSECHPDYMSEHESLGVNILTYGVATISRLLKLYVSFAKESYK